MKLIGLHGKAKAGKDTIASLLCAEHGFKQMSFAGPLKAATAVMFGWPVELMYSQEGKEMQSQYWGLAVRDALQRFGEGARKWFGEDFWVKRWLVDYSQVMTKLNIVISDVRYENEADTIRQYGGYIIHVHRNGAGLSGEQARHSSEAGIQFHDNDLVIDNNGTLDDLRQTVVSLVQLLDTQPQSRPN